MDKGFFHTLLVLVILVALLGFTGFYMLNQYKIPLEATLSPTTSAEEMEIKTDKSFIPATSIPTPTPRSEPNQIVVATPKPDKTTPSYRSITVAGFAYEDRTDDGTFNSDDIGLAYMQFYLFDTYDSKQVSTIYSDKSGNFSITLNIRGNLLIRPTSYNNFIAKSPDQTVASSKNGLMFRFRSASAPVPAQTIGILEGNVYHDANRSKSRDSGERGVYFYKLYLKDSSGNYFYTVENSQTTDAGGHFKFINLPVPATYTFVLSNPTGEYEILQPETTFSLTQTNFQNTSIEIPVFKY